MTEVVPFPGLCPLRAMRISASLGRSVSVLDLPWTDQIPNAEQLLRFSTREGHEFTRAAIGWDIAALAAEVCVEAGPHGVSLAHMCSGMETLSPPHQVATVA